MAHITAGSKSVLITAAQYQKATTPISAFSLNGSGFGTKAQAAPIKYDDFKAYGDDTTLQANDTDWEQYQTNGGGLIKSERARYSGAKHAYNDSTRSGFGTNFHTFTATDSVFISYWYSTDQAVYGADGTYWVGKLSRITSSPASGGGGVYNGLGSHALSSYNPSNESNPFLLLSNGVDAADPINYMAIPKSNTWFRVDMYVKLSDLDVANGELKCRTWGYDSYEDTSLINRKAAGGNYQLDSVILGLMHANHAGAAGGIKITDIHIDTTQHRVDLTDSPNYATSTWAEIQEVNSWSDTAVEGSIRSNGRSGRCFLHVIDSNGNSVHNEQVII